MEKAGTEIAGLAEPLTPLSVYGPLRIVPPRSQSAVDRNDERLSEQAVVDVQKPNGAMRLAATVGRRSWIEYPDAIGGLVQWYGSARNNELRGGKAAPHPLTPLLGQLIEHGSLLSPLQYLTCWRP